MPPFETIFVYNINLIAHRSVVAIEPYERWAPERYVTAVPCCVNVVEFIRLVDDTIPPTIRIGFDHIAGPRCIHIEVIEYLNGTAPVEVDSHDLIGTITFYLKFRVSLALPVHTLID